MKVRNKDVKQLADILKVVPSDDKTVQENFNTMALQIKNMIIKGEIKMRNNENTFEAVMNELSFGTLKNRVFGSYDAVERDAELLSINEKQVLSHFKNYVVDFADITSDIAEYKEDLINELLEEIVNKYDYERYIYLNDILINETMEEIKAFNWDMFEQIEDEILPMVHDMEELKNTSLDDIVYKNVYIDGLNIEFNNSGNSYNWSSSAVFNWDAITINENDYILIKFHKFGDVRGNYTSYLLLEMDEQTFFESLSGIYTCECIEINDTYYNIQYRVTDESNVFDVWCDEFDIDNVYINMDNSSIETIARDLKEYLIENNYITA